MVKQLHIIVTGRVHGVSYRYYVKNYAEQFGVKGFVKNLADGSVEIVAQAEDDVLEEFLEKCKKGPLLAKIKGFIVEEEELKTHFEFEVRH